MKLHKAYDEPSRVTAVQGEVVVDGPDGLGLALTPEAALKTGERLLEAAMTAMAQSSPGDDED